MKETKEAVREGYARMARQGSSCCHAPSSSCCGSAAVSQDTSKTVGYREEEMKTVCEGANSGLGCGSLIVPASLKTGGTVLDLGSGAGFDCFPAAREVGVKGKVIGVDMTPEMLDRTREDVRTGKYKNVEFMLGEIENLPVANRSVDVIISNCVINLSPDKAGVFAECLSLAAG